MLLISLTFYGDLTVNVNVASIFQIRFPVKGKLALLPGFLFGQNQVMPIVRKMVSTIRRHSYRSFLRAAGSRAGICRLPCFLCFLYHLSCSIHSIHFCQNRGNFAAGTLLPFILKRGAVRIPVDFRISI